MLHTINIYVWGTPATISISDDVLRWVYIADSVGLHRHRIVLLTRYIIKNKKFKIADKKRMQQEKQLLDILNKAVKGAGEIMFKQCRAYDTFDLHSACNAISKCESVNSKYYIHKYKGGGQK